jgi:hypothetical protein
MFSTQAEKTANNRDTIPHLMPPRVSRNGTYSFEPHPFVIPCESGLDTLNFPCTKNWNKTSRQSRLVDQARDPSLSLSFSVANPPSSALPSRRSLLRRGRRVVGSLSNRPTRPLLRTGDRCYCGRPWPRTEELRPVYVYIFVR